MFQKQVTFFDSVNAVQNPAIQMRIALKAVVPVEAYTDYQSIAISPCK